jgi:hypothetical protein
MSLAPLHYMPRTKASNKPGTERYRDERRADPKPKMRGRQWSDFNQPRDLDTASRVVGSATDDEKTPRGKVGLGKGKVGTRGAQRKRMTPVGKGRPGEHSKAQTRGAGRNVKAGAKGSKRA